MFVLMGETERDLARRKHVPTSENEMSLNRK